jgi:hypothetical protein
MEQLQRPERDPRPPVFQLIGGDTQSKLAIARQASNALGLGLYRTAADTIPPQGADHETLLRLWQRENALLPIALYIDATQVEHVAGGHAGAVQRWVSRAGGVVFFDTYEPWNDLSRDAIALDVAKPTPAEQYQAWTSLLGGAEHAARIAGHFSFNPTPSRTSLAPALPTRPIRPSRARPRGRVPAPIAAGRGSPRATARCQGRLGRPPTSGAGEEPPAPDRGPGRESQGGVRRLRIS